VRLLGSLVLSNLKRSGAETPVLVAQVLESGVTLVFARILVTLPFLVAGLQKLFFWQAGVGEMHAAGLNPSWLFNLASLITELGGSAAIILDRKTWLGAGSLGVFTFLGTLIAHRFWEFGGAARVSELNSFLEHMTICAAFILITVVSIQNRKLSVG
jgi:transmembrane protein